MVVSWYTPMFDSEGNVLILVIALDLTEQNTLEKKIQTLNADLLRLNSTQTQNTK